MIYSGLSKTYWETQTQRIERVREEISSGTATAAGRVIPEGEDLALGEGRRLKLAVMFLDISGFSARKMETPEEQELILRVLNLFFTEMIKIAEDYGATVEKNTGDGLMAYFDKDFGTDTANACTRATACALTMMATNAELLAPILRKSAVPEIEFRISIDYGWVTIARLGAPKRFNSNVAIGTTANFACKMLSKAKPGEIVLGETAKEQLPQEWQRDWTPLVSIETGWTYIQSKKNYPLYLFTGRWSRLVEN